MNTEDKSAPQFEKRVPQGDSQERSVCRQCGFIDYENPKIVAGAVVSWEGKILLCRRAIAPRRGFWTIPAGYLELHESTEQGAIRETWEEACATIRIDRLLAIYSITAISQVQLFFRAQMTTSAHQPGIESLETALFTYDEIPWDEIAFPSAAWALRHYWQSKDEAAFAPFSNPPQ